MKTLTGIAVFIFGTAVGSVATWYYTKKKYQKIANEEIKSVKEAFKVKAIPVEPFEDLAKEAENASAAFDNLVNELHRKEMASFAKEKPSVAEYAKELKKQGYTDYSKSGMELVNEEEDEEEENSDDQNPSVKYFGDHNKRPYVISPDEFGEYSDYSQISLTYYSDNVLADENNERVEDVDRAVGIDFSDHFGEYEDDSVFIRNERLKVDYEILLDQRKYSDILEANPYLKED